VLYVTLGTGLGAALVVDGKVVRVSRHTWGQIAHVPLGEAGPRCYCGRRGCAETLLSSRGILWRARSHGLTGVESCEELARVARRGTPRDSRAARAVWSGAGDALGRLLRILAVLVSPDAIVVGGGISGAAGLFLKNSRARLLEGLQRAHRPRLALVPARLGRFAGAMGAALLAREALLP
jgi:glucokinase